MRILDNEQYTGTLVNNHYESKEVGARRCVKLPKEEWKRVENCHPPIISKKDFMKIAELQKVNTMSFTGGNRHMRHCLVGKLKCGDCGYTLAHTYSECLKYYCNKRYLD